MKPDNFKRKKLQEIQETHSYFEKLTESFDCFLSDCENDSIASHSISQSRVLGSLTPDKTEKLFMIDDKYSSDFTQGKTSTFQARNRELVPVSQVSASTFRGFCNTCDKELFKELDDKEYSNTPEINFLHALRAYGFKLRSERKLFHFMKEEVFKLTGPLQNLLNTANDKLDEAYSHLEALKQQDQEQLFYWQIASLMVTVHYGQITALPISYPSLSNDEDYLKVRSLPIFHEQNYPIKLGAFNTMLSEAISFLGNITIKVEESKIFDKIDLIKEHAHEVLKHQNEVSSELTSCLRNKSYEEFKSVVHSVNETYSITGNFIFHTSENEELILTFFPEPEKNKTIFIFSAWNPSSTQDIYLKRINILDQPSLKQFVSNIILSQGTNIYVSKKYLETLEPKEKEVLQQIKVLKSLLTFNLFK